MAADASVKRTEELLVFSSFLQSFCDSMAKNGNSFSVLMTQKLEQLKNIQKGAIEVVEQLKEQEREAERAVAARPMREDYFDRVKACHAIHDKVLAAKRYLGTINLQVQVAQSAVLCIIEDTKMFQDETKVIIDKGRNLLGEAYTQLKLYQKQK